MVCRGAYSLLTKSRSAAVNPVRDYPARSAACQSNGDCGTQTEVKLSLDWARRRTYTDLTRASWGQLSDQQERGVPQVGQGHGSHRNPAARPGAQAAPMLILVDGKRKFEELVRLSSTLGDTEQLLEQLLADGFIEPVASRPAAAAPAPQVAVPVPILRRAAPAAPAATVVAGAAARGAPPDRHHGAERGTTLHAHRRRPATGRNSTWQWRRPKRSCASSGAHNSAAELRGRDQGASAFESAEATAAAGFQSARSVSRLTSDCHREAQRDAEHAR